MTMLLVVAKVVEGGVGFYFKGSATDLSQLNR